MAWITPKTNWVSSDYINAEDFNRIKGNIAYLQELAKALYPKKTFSYSLPEDMTYDDYAYSDYWNALENAMQEIIDNTYKLSGTGNKALYGSYDPYIDYIELNRLETLCVRYNTFLVGVKNSRETLPFTLGDYRGIKI